MWPQKRPCRRRLPVPSEGRGQPKAVSEAGPLPLAEMSPLLRSPEDPPQQKISPLKPISTA